MLNGLPEMPLLFRKAEALCDYPKSKKEIGGGVCGDGVPNPIRVNDQQLINHPAQHAGEPMLMS